jgi:hypothetical protein
MATQGLVSVVKDGQVILKAVTGSDGFLATKLAKIMKENNYYDARRVYDAALAIGFGSERNLVVIDQQGAIFDDGEDEVPPLYRETFNDPKFNPRWERGTVENDCLVVINL